MGWDVGERGVVQYMSLLRECQTVSTRQVKREKTNVHNFVPADNSKTLLLILFSCRRVSWSIVVVMLLATCYTVAMVECTELTQCA
jgi:hypothetical protein